MESDQLWDSVIHQTECELLQSGSPHEPDVPLSVISGRNGSAPQNMGAHDISIFIDVTAQSHKCDPQNISYYYDPIIGDDGQVVLDELLLIFTMKSLIGGVLDDRIIHTIRVIVPQEVQQRARAMLEHDATLRYPTARSASADSAAEVCAHGAPIDCAPITISHAEPHRSPEIATEHTDTPPIALDATPSAEHAESPPKVKRVRRPRAKKIAPSPADV